jgi:hypothetical protein
VPFNADAARRHDIPKQRHRVTNWAEDDAALRQRGSLTIWFTVEPIAAWRAEPRPTRGGQPHDSALAIRMTLSGASGRLRGIMAVPSDLLAEATHDTGLLTGHDGC